MDSFLPTNYAVNIVQGKPMNIWTCLFAKAGQQSAADSHANSDFRTYPGSEDYVDFISVLQPLDGVLPEADPWASADVGCGEVWLNPVPRSCAHVEDVHGSIGCANADADADDTVDDGQGERTPAFRYTPELLRLSKPSRRLCWLH